MSAAPPVFGKRNSIVSPRQGAGAPLKTFAPDPAPAGDYAAFLAETRENFAKREDVGPAGVVPRSVLAALLAAVIVGCCLAGLDIARAKDGAATGGPIDLAALLGGGMAPIGGGGGISPALVAGGVLAGGRAAAVCLLIVREGLTLLGVTSHIAYAAAGAASALAFAALLAFALGIPPSHGWLVTGLAGAGAGFFYRMFAGCRA